MSNRLDFLRIRRIRRLTGVAAIVCVAVVAPPGSRLDWPGIGASLPAADRGDFRGDSPSGSNRTGARLLRPCTWTLGPRTS